MCLIKGTNGEGKEGELKIAKRKESGFHSSSL
jgi:hypothetical protein